MNNVIYSSTFKQFEELELMKASFTSQTFKPHFHEQYAFIFLENGLVDYSYKKNNFIIDSGTLLILNPYEVHTGRSLTKGQWDFRSMYISPHLLKELSTDIAQDKFAPFFKDNIVKAPQVLRKFRDIHESLLDEQDVNMVNDCLFDFLKSLEKISEIVPMEENWEGTPSKAGALKDYIHDHFTENIRLDELGREMGLSKFYLIRLFESVYGLSPIRYLINLRIEAAKKLLFQGMKYTEVAYATGFYDQSHFIRHFKMIVGVTPKAFT